MLKQTVSHRSSLPEYSNEEYDDEMQNSAVELIN